MHGAPRGLSPYSARLQTTCPHGVISTASTGTGTAAEAAAARAIGRGDGPPSSARFMTLPGVASGSPGVEVGLVLGGGNRLSPCGVEQTLLVGNDECDAVDAVRPGDRDLVEEISALDRARAP